MTSGTDFTGVRHLLARAVPGGEYTARDAIAYLLGHDLAADHGSADRMGAEDTAAPAAYV